MNFLLLIIIPILVGVGAFLAFKTITGKEFVLQLVGCVLVAVIGWSLAKWGSTRDTENLNGRITRKIDGTQKCCHCQDVCTKKDDKGNCISYEEECSHFHDYYWKLATSVGDIDVEDCSGYDNPPSEWERAFVGEPASVENGYTNYLLADPDSLMIHGVTDKFRVPKYPRVKGLYQVNHVVGDVSAPSGWQKEVREINADLGHSNQVDVTILLTSEKDPTYAQAVEANWLYGPKNSLNIVMGVDGDSIRWVRVVTFSKVEMLKVRLRDQLQGLSLNDPKVLNIIRSEIKSGFHRTAMADFAYLASSAQPKGWALFGLIVLQLVVSVGLSILMHTKDVFGDEGSPFKAANPFKRRNPFT